ncbi:MFS transporter [Steroidobacter sp.]|uniref:MFS transporter n=1 Tax=Steroidobacter sp. TaxID=1978227 RepID=UPI002ED8FF28
MEAKLEWSGGREQSAEPSGVVARHPDYEKAWWVLLGASLCIFSGSASVAYYTFGVFLPEIIAATKWSGPALAATIGPGLLAASVVAPLAGMACDKFGVRAIVLIGAPAIGIGFAILGMAPTSAGGFAAATILMYLLFFAGSPVPYARMLSGWFDTRRGMALSIMFASGSIGIACWPQYAAFLIAHLGWRHAYVAMGGSAAAVVLFAALFMLKDPPGAGSTSDSGATAGRTGLLVREALRTVRFWKLCAVFMLLTAVLGGTAVIFPVILRMQGADPSAAASIMSVIGIAMFVGRLSLGLTLDRFFAPYVTLCISIISTLAFVIMILGGSTKTLFAAGAFLGFGLGAEYAVTAYIVSRAFGIRSFGSIYGLITTATSIGAAIGPAVLGAALVSSVGIRTLSFAALAVLLVPILLLLTVSRKDLPFQAR